MKRTRFATHFTETRFENFIANQSTNLNVARNIGFQRHLYTDATNISLIEDSVEKSSRPNLAKRRTKRRNISCCQEWQRLFRHDRHVLSSTNYELFEFERLLTSFAASLWPVPTDSSTSFHCTHWITSTYGPPWRRKINRLDRRIKCFAVSQRDGEKGSLIMGPSIDAINSIHAFQYISLREK